MYYFNKMINFVAINSTTKIQDVKNLTSTSQTIQDGIVINARLHHA